MPRTRRITEETEITRTEQEANERTGDMITWSGELYMHGWIGEVREVREGEEEKTNGSLGKGDVIIHQLLRPGHSFPLVWIYCQLKGGRRLIRLGKPKILLILRQLRKLQDL